MRLILFTVALLSSIGGAFTLVSIFGYESVTHQQLIATLAIALAVIPYCLARSYQELTRAAAEKKVAHQIGQAVADALNTSASARDVTPSQFLLKH